MKLRTPLFALLFAGMLATTACARSSEQATNPSSQTTAQNSTPGMSNGNGQMNMQQSPGSSMSGMNHGMNMSLGPKDANFDLRFIDAMIPHHQGAVMMAKEALEKSQRPEIKQLAQDIIDAQNKEIQQLQEWRTAWYPNADTQPIMYDAQNKKDMPMSQETRSKMMMQGGLGAADDQFDLRFMNAMTQHHQNAIDMAQQALQNSDRPEIKELAQNIIDTQQKEIDQMKQWKQQWYGQ